MNTHPTRATQRGAATLAIALMLVFVIFLGVGFANRSLLFEARTSVNQYHAAQAFEAAEAGLEWAVVLMNRQTPVGDDCLPSSDSAATLFRERALSSMQASCALVDGVWSCHCPASGEPRASERGGSTLSFIVRFTATEQPGLLRLTSTGTLADVNPTRAQVQQLLGRVPGLDSPPAAALTVRGTPSFGSALFGAHHTDPASGGLTVHSGGAIDTASLPLVSAPGTPAAASVLDQDSDLFRMTPEQLFASVFRMDKTTWQSQPAVREINCESACDSALTQTVGNPVTNPLVWLQGGLRLDTPMQLGTPQRPVLLVVDGPVELHAAAVIHGVVYSTASTWTDTAGASLHGAVILEGDLQASGPTQIHHNAAVLAALHERTGSYARLPGSWRDF